MRGSLIFLVLTYYNNGFFPGALTICTKKPFFPDEMSNGTVQPGENFPE